LIEERAGINFAGAATLDTRFAFESANVTSTRLQSGIVLGGMDRGTVGRWFDAAAEWRMAELVLHRCRTPSNLPRGILRASKYGNCY